MQVDRIQVLVQQAAAGNVEAFVALVQEFAPRLRLALGAHLDQSAALIPVELAVWSAVRSRLGEWLPEMPFPQWLQQVAMEPVAAHLAQADRRAIDIQDALSHQVIEQCREALTYGSELQVTDLPARLAGLPDAARTLLQRRYRERQRPAALAASLMISEPELATTLAIARAACDWREIAKPPGPGDRLLPPLIEDWLNGTIDVDSRALLATNLGRDLERAAQFARQVRIHLALGAALAPFTRDDAAAITRQTGLGAGDSGRVMMGEGLRPTVAARPPGSEVRRPARASTANRQEASLADDTPRPSPMPWIIGGGMVLVGVMALVLSSLGSGALRTLVPSTTVPPPKPAAVGTIPEQPAANRPNAAGGGILRPLPIAPGDQKVMLVGVAAGTQIYTGVPFELRALVSSVPEVTEVEYWAGNQRLGSARDIPFSVKWTPSQPGAVTVQARVLVGAVTKISSDPVPLTVMKAFGSGQLTREWWSGLPGDEVALGIARLTSTTPATGRSLENQFSAPRSWEDSYIQRLSGYLTPPLDGEYVFWICADNEAELWLSTDDSYANRTRIAVSPFIAGGAVPYQAWDHDTRQRSAPIRLRAGQRYYCEALHKEGGGDDHMDVGWQLPDGTLQRPIPGVHLTPAPAAPTPTGPAVVPTPSPAVNVAPAPSMLVLWNGDNVAGGSGYASSGITKVAGSGRDGSTGLQATIGGGFVNLGWNWLSWAPDDAGSDLRTHKAIAFWLRIEGANRPTSASLQFLSSPKSIQARSASIDVDALVPQFADGQWHEVVVPVDRLAAPGFDLAKVWEFNLKLQGKGTLASTVSFDDITALPQLPAVAPTTAPTPPVVVSPANAVVAPWKVVRAINLGGEATEVEGVKFIGHRQAEADGASLPGSHQPGPWLSDLNWIRATTGVDAIRRDLSMSGQPLKLDGKVYAKGLGVHAHSEVVYAVDSRYSAFSAVVGINDVVQGGEAIFQVWLDGQKVWDSGVVRKGMPKAVAVPLTGRKELRLVVDPNGPNDWDQADWANAQFLVPGGDDGALQVQIGRRTTVAIVPKPPVEPRVRALLGTALLGTKEGLAFRVKAPNGPNRVWLWLAENGTANSRQFDLTIEGVTLTGVGSLPTNGWEKIGPVDVDVADGTINVAATVLKGIPQVMGILIEQPVPPPVIPTSAEQSPVDDFERDAPEWAYVGGAEYPGAKGMAVRETGTAHGGTGAYRLDWDFTGGGVYVGLWKKFETIKVPDITEVHLWVKAAGVPAFGVRLLDSSNQLHQSSVRLAATNEWQEVVVKIAQAVGGEHWEGANDGRWHPPLKGLGLNVGKEVVSGTLWIDDVTFVVAPAPKP